METFLANNPNFVERFGPQFGVGGVTGGAPGASGVPGTPTPSAAPIAGYDQLTALYTPAAGINPGAGYANPFAPIAPPPSAPPPANVPNTTNAVSNSNYNPYQTEGGEQPGWMSDPYRGTRGPGSASGGYISPVGGGLTEDVLYGRARPESTGGGWSRTGQNIGGAAGGLLGGPLGGLLGAGVGGLLGGVINRQSLPPTIGYASGKPSGGGPSFPINAPSSGYSDKPDAPSKSSKK